MEIGIKMITKKITTPVMATIAFSVSLLMGCSDSSTSTKAAEPVAKKDAAPMEMKLADVQEIVLGNGSEPGSIDPQKVEGQVGSRIVRDLFEGLINQDADGNVIPGVALSWEASEGNKVYTFKLRDNAVWSNGDKVVAQDFVDGWQRITNPETASPYSWFFGMTTMVNANEIIAGEKDPSTLGVKAIDETTLRVELNSPLPYFVKMTGHQSMFPANLKNINEFGADWTEPGNMVSNGAYTLSEWVVNEKIVAVRNDKYWDNENTTINKVTFLPLEDQNTDLARWEAGEIHATYEVPNNQMNRLKADFADNLVFTTVLSTYYYEINTTKAPFDNADLRTALSLAINRDIIVEKITKGGQKPAFSMVPDITAGYTPYQSKYLSMTQEEREALALELFEKAGFSKDEPLTFDLLYNTSDNHKAIAVAVGQMWKEVLGVQATPTNLEWKSYLTERHAGNFDIARSGWAGDYNEASTFLDLMSSASASNDTGWVSPEYDNYMVESKSMADPSAVYEKAEALLVTDMPVIPLYFYTKPKMISLQVGGWPVQNAEEYIYTKDLYMKAM